VHFFACIDADARHDEPLEAEPRLMIGFVFTWLASAGRDLMPIENFH
jgi:hypothetical protein